MCHLAINIKFCSANGNYRKRCEQLVKKRQPAWTYCQSKTQSEDSETIWRINYCMCSGLTSLLLIMATSNKVLKVSHHTTHYCSDHQRIQMQTKKLTDGKMACARVRCECIKGQPSEPGPILFFSFRLVKELSPRGRRDNSPESTKLKCHVSFEMSLSITVA